MESLLIEMSLTSATAGALGFSSVALILILFAITTIYEVSSVSRYEKREKENWRKTEREKEREKDEKKNS